MFDDPVVEEVHRIRERMLAEHGGDLRALMESIRQSEKEAMAAGRKFVSLPPRRPVGYQPLVDSKELSPASTDQCDD